MTTKPRSGRRTALVGAAAAIMLLLGAAALAAYGPAPRATAAPVEWDTHRLGPRDSARIYWVGHSLTDAVDPHHDGSKNIMDLVASFASHSGLEHDHYDHTLFGSSLALNWRGSAHSYEREEPQMLERRQELDERGARYDTLVMTEGIPVGPSMEREHSAYYAEQFYCAMVRANPEARVYMYESWTHLHASDPDGQYGPPERWDWRQRLVDDRALWEGLADEASTVRVPPPTAMGRLKARVLGLPEPACEPGAPIFIVPVGAALVALHDRLMQPEDGDDWTLPDGSTLTIGKLFRNAYTEWPTGWPLSEGDAAGADPQRALSELRLEHPGEEPDDIHASQLGSYFAALVHYATIYRRSPLGLPAVNGVSEPVAAQLQAIAWETVRNDPRTGVRR